MAATLAHRGPDDGGIWTDASAGFGLGFRRLSIIDLSVEGRQPMISATRRYVIVFNGEVYNFAELRAQLERNGHKFRGGSDTEVILAGTEEWGFEEALLKLNGMFAIALWDQHCRTLSLARDRLGIKPIYYGWFNKSLLFGSQLRAFWAYPRFRPEVDRGAVLLYIRHDYVPGPWSIYHDIFKLQPGCTVVFKSPLDRAAPRAFWSLKNISEEAVRAKNPRDAEQAIENLDVLLRDAVKRQMVSDVPLGAFLSGGIDSSLVVSLMAAQSVAPVRTFTIGFKESAFDEAPHAKRIAERLGAIHTELYVTPKDLLGTISHLPEWYCEPFADSSQIPTYLVSRLTRRYVTVALSGDGGDELFGGYTRYFTRSRQWRCSRLCSTRVRALLGRICRCLGRRDMYWHHPTFIGRTRHRLNYLGMLFEIVAEEEAYAQMVSIERTPSFFSSQGAEPTYAWNDRTSWAALPSFFERAMYLDSIAYLPDDILVKLDRASMAVGLEARVPLLDHRVVEFAWSLPIGVKVRDGLGKWILRQVLARYVPPRLFERPKAGFAIPIGEWLRGDLREWAEAMLDQHRLRNQGVFNPEPIRARWMAHLAGRVDWSNFLWGVIMFQVWHDRWG